ncbi:dTDP-4-dehydrorhamnose reductase [Deltaproteobacteria bacterium Smac51]|nr:dTDP-4-dehydrorhamnose reductase [Deltaproteobacteria bacterium Smac51]
MVAILLLGAQGQLGWELGASLSALGKVLHFGRKEADLSRLDELRKLVLTIKPRVIINAAAHTKVDQAEDEPELAGLINAEAPAMLASLAKELDAWLVHYSTDYVFDGTKDGVYTEDDATAPLNVYGQSKLDGDKAIMASGCRHLIFRTSWVFGHHGRNFPRTILELARQEDHFSIVADQFGSPTGVELISSVTALALNQAQRSDQNLSGLYNLVASGYVNWQEYAIYVVRRAIDLGWSLLADPDKIIPRSTEESGRKAVRPANSRLSTEKLTRVFGLTPPPWQYYVDRVLWAWTREYVAANPNPPKILGLKFIPPMNGAMSRS